MVEVSLIIPVYNVEKYLPRCLDSVLAQTFTDFEAILVDDGSTDGSGKICDEYALKDNRFKVIHKENGGASSARNAGLQNAGGKYIVFLDSDDAVEPDYLSVLMKPSEEYELVICGVKKISGDGTPVQELSFTARQYEEITPDGVCDMIVERSMDYNCAKRFDMSIIKSKGIAFDLSITMGEDTLFVVRYLKHCQKICFVPETSYLYYQHRGTLSGFNETYVERMQEANRLIAESLKERFPAVLQSLAWKKRVFSVYHYAVSCIIGGDHSFAARYRMLKDIYRRPDFKEFVRQPKVYMPGDSPKFCKALAKKSPLWLLAVSRLARLKARFS